MISGAEQSLLIRRVHWKSGNMVEVLTLRDRRGRFGLGLKTNLKPC